MTKLPFEAAQPRKFDYFSVFLWPDKVNFNSKECQKARNCFKTRAYPTTDRIFHSEGGTNV